VGAGAGERDSTTNYLALGDNNTFLGAYASPVGNAARNFATAIGAYASVSTDNTIVLGRTTDTTVIGATGTASSGLLQNKILQVTGDVGITGNLEIGGTFTATAFSGNGSGLTNLNASNISSGTLGAAFGGTGVNSSTAANGQLLIGNGSGFALGNLTGTADQVLVSNGAGTITLSLPQSIAATSTPTFGGLTVNGQLQASGNALLNSNVASYTQLRDLRILSSLDNATWDHFRIRTDGAATNIYAGGAEDGLIFSVGQGASGDVGGQAYARVLRLMPDQRALFDGAVQVAGNIQANRLLLGDPTGVTNPNIAIGSNNLVGAQSGFGSNIAIGLEALQSNTSGEANIGIGRQALQKNMTGQSNLAIGDSALRENTSGYLNVALGNDALSSNTTGFYNLAIGDYALGANVNGNRNLALGYLSLYENTAGSSNLAFGNHTMFFNDTGMRNVAVGEYALGLNQAGSDNVALGYGAGRTTLAGGDVNANITGSNNTFLGSYAMPGTTTQLNYATALGSESLVTSSNTIVLGRTTDTTVIGATGTASSGLLQNKILQVTGDVGISGNLAIGGTFSATGFSGNGSGLTNLNASNISSGTLGVAFGGTGVDSSTATNGQLLIGNGSGFSLATITAGTGIGVSNGVGAITITNNGVTSFNGRTGAVSLLLADVNNVSAF
ncbi:MAG TPA: hypothetical protein VFV43_02210, partial [Limnobacter sp.]|nr:hypothetical protein [Limnobacter sp.]